MSIDGVTNLSPGSSESARSVNRLRETTGKVIGSVFYGTLFQIMRDSKMKGAYGHGGRGEEVFQAQLHGILAEKMGARGGRGLSETISSGLEKQQRLISEKTNGG